MASTARSKVCGRCSLGRALATACATRSINSRRNSWPSPPRSARPSLPVSHPVVPGTTAQRLAGVCAGPAVTPLCRPRRRHGWGGQRRARAALVPGQEGGLVCGARRPRRCPATSTLLDQAHNAIERKLFAMKGFHHPDGSQQAFLTGLAHLYNLVPYQRRAQHAGQCGVEVEGGKVPTRDWFLNLQILTSGGFR